MAQRQRGDDLGLGLEVAPVRCPAPRVAPDAPVFDALRNAVRAGDAAAVHGLLRATLDAALEDALSRGHADVANVLVRHGAVRSSHRTFRDTFQ